MEYLWGNFQRGGSNQVGRTYCECRWHIPQVGGPDYIERGEKEKSEDKSKPAELRHPGQP